MKNIYFLFIVIFLCTTSIWAQKKERPERCTAVGTWKSAGGSQGSFRWDVLRTWNNGVNNNAYGFSLRNAGNNMDEYGGFRISGGCSEGFCDFSQTYTSGKFSGRKYSYVKGYTSLNPLKLSNGDYYRSDVNEGSKGTFTITSMVCK